MIALAPGLIVTIALFVMWRIVRKPRQSSHLARKDGGGCPCSSSVQPVERVP